MPRPSSPWHHGMNRPASIVVLCYAATDYLFET